MSKNYDDYKPLNPAPPRKRRNPLLAFVQYAIISLLIISLIISAMYFVFSHNDEKNNVDKIEKPPVSDIEPNETEPSTPDKTPEEDEENKEDEVIPPAVDLDSYTMIDVPKGDIHKGNLILVGAGNKVVHPTADDLITLRTARSASYKDSWEQMKVHKNIVENLNKMMDDFYALTQKDDVMVQTGYRDEKRQAEVFNEYKTKYGEETAKMMTSQAGESDHHTGLGVVLLVQRDKTYELSQLEGYEWIAQNCHKYGFVVRYPADKANQTGLNYTNTTYLRYVGIPQSQLMYNNSWCLEELIMIMRSYPFESAHYDFVGDGNIHYEMYFVSGQNEGETVQIPVPKDKYYTISGNNIDGFIVTAEK